MRRFRPIVSMKKLAVRVAVVTLVVVVASNVYLWFSMYFEVFGFRRDFLSPQSLQETLVVFGYSTLFWSVVLVPAATLVVTPLILHGTTVMQKWVSVGIAFGAAIVMAIVVFVVSAVLVLRVLTSTVA